MRTLIITDRTAAILKSLAAHLATTDVTSIQEDAALAELVTEATREPDETAKRLRRMCQNYADQLSEGPTMAWVKNAGHDLGALQDADNPDDPQAYENPPSAAHWVEYGIQSYTVDYEGDCVGGVVILAGGGPSVEVNTATRLVEGHWGTDTVTVPFTDNWGLDDYIIAEYADRFKRIE